MILQGVDWVIIFAYFLLSLIVGVAFSKKAGSSTTEFFLSGRKMPWWLLGVSMVATTFSADTPNLVTDIVRNNGVAGNWLWWAFLFTGMLTVFIYSKLWRRSNVMTDIEFYELRYSGKPAAFLRGFRAVYLGFFYNVIVMAAVTLAMIKICGVILKLSPMQTLIVAIVITTVYSSLGGLFGVLLTDLVQFVIAMTGSIWAAIYVVKLPQVGGLSKLLTHPNLSGKLSILPDFSKLDFAIAVFFFPLIIQWWNVWYPGAEPGGGGYIAQRMLAAKNEKHAMGSTFLFNVLHYALRPWPWILVALASLVVFPNLEALQAAFPHIAPGIMKHDLAYPAMMTFLPRGLIGMVIASLFAAYMSTIATHLNWGSSYMVNDFYKRFVKTDAPEKRLVMIGRISTFGLMLFSSLLALLLRHALEAFQILLLVGAGTGLIFILRWFWWRINAYSELTAMVVSFIIALYFKLVHSRLGFKPLADWQQLLIGIVITTISWITVTLLTRPTDEDRLRKFYRLVHPGGPGWKHIMEKEKAAGLLTGAAAEPWDLPVGILCMLVGCLAVWGALFAVGYWIYGNYAPAAILTLVAAISGFILIRLWRKLKTT
jgi:SSS family solute:Na+ symporter